MIISDEEYPETLCVLDLNGVEPTSVGGWMLSTCISESAEGPEEARCSGAVVEFMDTEY